MDSPKVRPMEPIWELSAYSGSVPAVFLDPFRLSFPQNQVEVIRVCAHARMTMQKRACTLCFSICDDEFADVCMGVQQPVLRSESIPPCLMSWNFLISFTVAFCHRSPSEHKSFIYKEAEGFSSRQTQTKTHRKNKCSTRLRSAVIIGRII